jgi:hypothetical protein
MSLREECDHLVIELALRRLCRRTVITPRLASIPSLLLKAFLFLFVRFSLASPFGPTLGTLFSLGKFIQLLARALPSHPILLGVISLFILVEQTTPCRLWQHAQHDNQRILIPIAAWHKTQHIG